VPALCSYDYAVIRVVPRVEREEFINVGVILSCPSRDFLQVRIALDAARLQALDPGLDPEMVRRHLRSFEVICRGGPDALAIGALKPRERFYWLVAPRSTVIQTSAVHGGSSEDPERTLETLLRNLVHQPAHRRDL
jgi:hypothetical protein